MSSSIFIYPKNRPPFFALKVIRVMLASRAANDIGPAGIALIVAIATQEDTCGYKRAVSFWNDSLMSQVGISDKRTLAKVRGACITHGWLCYEPGGTRKAGKYYATIPKEFFDDKQGQDDDSLGTSNAPNHVPNHVPNHDTNQKNDDLLGTSNAPNRAPNRAPNHAPNHVPLSSLTPYPYPYPVFNTLITPTTCPTPRDSECDSENHDQAEIPEPPRPPDRPKAHDPMAYMGQQEHAEDFREYWPKIKATSAHQNRLLAQTRWLTLADLGFQSKQIWAYYEAKHVNILPNGKNFTRPFHSSAVNADDLQDWIDSGARMKRTKAEEIDDMINERFGDKQDNGDEISIFAESSHRSSEHQRIEQL